MSEKYETIVPSEPDAGERLQWVSWLRSAAPYVHLHHGRTFVISFAGEVVADRTLLNHLVMDVSLIASMGMRVVLVHGSRPQIEELMGLRKLEGQFYKGVRITGPQELECVKEACGETRFDIEAAFSQGLPNTPMQHSRIKVVSGNFVTARPMGIIDGVDYLHTGVVRKVDAESIQDLLSRGNIVLVSPTGFSPTGEAFNLTTEDVATAIAVAIHADKLILSVGVDGVRIRGEKQQDLTAQQAQALIQSKQVDDEDVYNLGYALRAIKGGVDRVHIVPYAMDGGILTELFTHDGVGTMISTENMESLREATIDDVAAIVKLLEPFEAEGILVKRPREKNRTRNQSLHRSRTRRHHLRFRRTVSLPRSRNRGDGSRGRSSGLSRGRRRRSATAPHRTTRREAGLKRIFVLTTRTAHWFIKRGFEEAAVENLPIEKQRMYNWHRRSKIFIKTL